MDYWVSENKITTEYSLCSGLNESYFMFDSEGIDFVMPEDS